MSQLELSMFPKHKCGLHLTHNQHKDYYETVEKYFENPWMENWNIPEDEKKKMIETDEIWELQWYPDTPVGFYKVMGSTLESVLQQAKKVENGI